VFICPTQLLKVMTDAIPTLMTLNSKLVNHCPRKLVNFTRKN
jgi:hypothetical protein